MQPEQPAVWILALIGLGTGIASGVFGIGGGVIVVPAFIIFLGFSQHRAVGTSLALMLPPIGLLAVLEYWRKGNVDFRVAGWVCITMAIGAGVGGVLANKLPAPCLRLAFGVFILGLGAWMIYGAWQKIGGVQG